MSRKLRKKGRGRRKVEARRQRKAQQDSKKRALGKALPSNSRTSKNTDMSNDDFQVQTEILKIDEELGLVLGWAIVSTIDGQPYFDLQGDYIPEDAMLKAAADFMMNSRVAGHMHKVEERGSVVFAFPMTSEIASAFGIQTQKTGLMIAMKPDEEMLQKFRDGELTGFSIGGKREVDEEVAV